MLVDKIIILTIFLSFAFKASGDELGLDCPTVDLSETYKAFKNPKISQAASGIDFNTCYATTASRLLEAELSRLKILKDEETVSWLSLAINSRGNTFFGKNSDIQYGNPCDIIKYASANDVCLQKDNKVDKYLTPDQFKKLQKEYKKYTSILMSKNDNDFFYNSDSVSLKNKKKFISEILCPIDSNIIVNDHLLEMMETIFSNQFIGNLVNQRCTTNAKTNDLKCNSISNNSKADETKISIQILKNLLISKPTGVAFCSNFKIGDKGERLNPREDCKAHAATIIGSYPYKLFNGKTVCRLKILDSYEDGKCLMGGCKNGAYGIEMDFLLENTDEIMFL